MKSTLVFVSGLVGASLFALSAAAEDVAVTRDDGSFEPVGSVFLVDQADDRNVAGIVQTSPLAEGTIFQTGFYNRGVIVQSGADPLATVDQLGEYNRALILQQTGSTNGLIVQGGGGHNTAIILQTGAVANTADVTQDGDKNANVQIQDAGAFVPLSQGELETVATNFLFAPETARAGVELIELDGTNFSDSVLGHLDRLRGLSCPLQAAEVTAPTKGDPADNPYFCDGFRLWAHGEYSGGDQDGRLGAQGFNYDTGSVLAGGEYMVTPALTIGVAGRYAHVDADVSHDFADIDLDSYGVSVYGDYARNGFFLSSALSYSWNDLDIDRPGFGDSVGADPDGDTFGAALRGGYLFDLTGFQAGPIAGLTYSDASLDGYGEDGPSLLAQSVPDQDAKNLLLMAGARFAVDRTFDTYTLRAHADIAYEHEFENDGFSVLKTEFDFASGVSIYTPVAELDDQDYLRLAGGLSVQLDSKVELGLTAGGRVFGNERESYNVAGELSVPF